MVIIRYGGSLFAIAVGAILYFAVAETWVYSINLKTVGLILMIVGAIGLVLSFLIAAVNRYRTPYEPPYSSG